MTTKLIESGLQDYRHICYYFYVFYVFSNVFCRVSYVFSNNGRSWKMHVVSDVYGTNMTETYFTELANILNDTAFIGFMYFCRR